MDMARLQAVLGGFPKARVAVIGDFFLDKILFIDRSLDEDSLETGLTAYQVTGRTLLPGAAGTVTNNLAALDAGEIYAVGAIGDDGEGCDLLAGLKARGVHTDYILRSEKIFTPTYVKPMFDYAQGPEETHRLDVRNRAALPPELEDAIIENLFKAAEHVDAVIALDQVIERNTGVITDRVREAFARLSAQKPNLITYADSRAFTPLFKNCIIKCNHLEAINAVDPGFSGEADEARVLACALVLSKTRQRPAFITWGARGSVIVEGGEPVHIPGVKAAKPIDIVGAGDATTAGFVMGLCGGATLEEAALIANITSSITIEQIGTTGVATREGIARRFLERVNV